MLGAGAASATDSSSVPLPRMTIAGCLAIPDPASRKICLDKQQADQVRTSYGSTVTLSATGQRDGRIPDFDVDNMCAKAYGKTEIQGIGSGAKWCILQMQSGYNAVKSVWDEATLDIKRECVRRNHEVPQTSPFKYQFLYRCLVNEMSEARRKELFSRDVHFQR
jgi:hypothetical protein